MKNVYIIALFIAIFVIGFWVIGTISENDTMTQSGILPFDSGIMGKVLIGPMCPVVKEGDKSCEDRPYATKVQVIAVGSPSGAPFSVVDSDKEGKYKVMLPPGEYSLQPIGGRSLPRCSMETVTVKPSKILEVNLFCDSGIR